MRKEPVLLTNLAQLLVVIAASLGFDLQEEHILGFLVVITTIGGLIARRFAWAPESVERLLGEQGKAAKEEAP